MQANIGISIIVPDSVIIVDGQAYLFDFAAPADVWAVHWDVAKGVGEVEYSDGRSNASIDDFTPFASVLTDLDAYLATIPPSPFHVLVNDQWEIDLDLYRAKINTQINADRGQAIAGSVTYDGIVFDSDDVSRNNLTSMLTAVQAGVPLPAGFTWRSKNDQDVPLDATGLIELAAAMLGHVNLQYQKSWDLKAQVAAAMTVVELDAIAW